MRPVDSGPIPACRTILAGLVRLYGDGVDSRYPGLVKASLRKDNIMSMPISRQEYQSASSFRCSRDQRALGGVRCALALLVLAGLAGGCKQSVKPATKPLDLSGLAWIEGDTFLGVHDSKTPGRARVSLLQLPGGTTPETQRLRWQEAAVKWPEPGDAMDLESAARVPGTSLVLLSESGQAIGTDGQQLRRMFLVEHDKGALKLRETTRWPEEVENVEGTAVARVGEKLVFMYAERAQGYPETLIRWAVFHAEPLIGFGPFSEAVFRSPIPASPQSRPISALEVADDGSIYAASAMDPDVDDGPYFSVVSKIGTITAGASGKPEVKLDPRPQLIATVDGLRIEALAVRPRSDGTTQVFIGTDDENYGAVLRPLPERGK